MRKIENRGIVALEIPNSTREKYDVLQRRCVATLPGFNPSLNLPHITEVYFNHFPNRCLPKVREIVASYSPKIKGERIRITGAGKIRLNKDNHPATNFHLKVDCDALGEIQSAMLKDLRDEGLVSNNYMNKKFYPHLTVGHYNLFPSSDSSKVNARIRSLMGILEHVDWYFEASGFVINRGTQRINVDQEGIVPVFILENPNRSEVGRLLNRAAF